MDSLPTRGAPALRLHSNLDRRSLGLVWIGTFGGGLSLYSTTAFTQIHLPIIYTSYTHPTYAVPIEAVPPCRGCAPGVILPFATEEK